MKEIERQLEGFTQIEQVKKPRYFAKLKVINPKLLSEITSRGGKRVHELGLAHRYTSEEASEAGKKGGRKAAQERDMSELGRKGGEENARRRREKEAARSQEAQTIFDPSNP